MSSTLVKKLNIKEMGCDATVARDSKYAPDKNVLLCAIYGRAHSVKTWERKDNQELCSCLAGEFEGVNKQEGTAEYGKMFNAGLLFLPGGAQELIEGVIGDQKDANVEFSFDIYSRYDKGSPVGYRYQVASLKPPAVTDDLAALRQLAGVPNVLAIAAGEPEPEPEPEPVIDTKGVGEPIKEAVKAAAKAKGK